MMKLPVQSVEEVKQYYPWFSKKEYERRYQLVREEMKRRNLDCLIVYGEATAKEMNNANVVWLSNWPDEIYAYVIFPLEGKPTLLAPSIYGHLVDVKTLSVIEDVRWKGDKNIPDFGNALVERIKELKLEKGRIGITGCGYITLDASHYNVMKQKLPKAHIEFVQGLFEKVRMIKSPEEIKFIKKAAEITDLGMEALVNSVKVGAKEYELAAAIEYAIRKNGGYNVIQLVGSHPMAGNYCCPNPWWYPSARPLNRGDIVLTEIAGKYGGYSTQICRPIALGKPTKEYQDLFEISLEVYKRTQRALKPGNTEQDIIEASAPIVEAGLTSMTPIIHGWSMCLEPPFVGLTNQPGYKTQTPVEFKENMTIMIEPNPCTLDLKRAIYFGDMNLVTKTGGKSFSKYPLEFVVV